MFGSLEQNPTSQNEGKSLHRDVGKSGVVGCQFDPLWTMSSKKETVVARLRVECHVVTVIPQHIFVRETSLAPMSRWSAWLLAAIGDLERLASDGLGATAIHKRKRGVWSRSIQKKLVQLKRTESATDASTNDSPASPLLISKSRRRQPARWCRWRRRRCNPLFPASLRTVPLVTISFDRFPTRNTRETMSGGSTVQLFHWMGNLFHRLGQDAIEHVFWPE